VTAQAPTPDPDVSAPQKHQSSSSRGRLVLLEDNDAVRAATELFLNLEGYETRSAGSIAEAETLLADLQPGDILISDYHLDNRLTGLDVLQQLRLQQRRDVPAVLLSGDLQSMMRVIKTAIPNCRFLSKPVDTAALLEAIEELGSRA
jgi:two-component system CheB/CheR fusion protein